MRRVVTIADEIRPGALPAVQKLNKLGIGEPSRRQKNRGYQKQSHRSLVIG